jgi:hypothetical protein
MTVRSLLASNETPELCCQMDTGLYTGSVLKFFDIQLAAYRKIAQGLYSKRTR